jgi:alkylhydroperoxidase family enzyme
VRESVGLKDHSKIPAVFGLMLKHPKLYRCQMDMGVQLFNGAIPVRDRELAVMRVGWLCRAPYEWGQHVIIAKRYGITTEEVERVTHGSAATGWSEHEAAILGGVEELIGNQMISDATWNTLASTWNDQQLIEFPTLIGQYVATAYSQNALRVQLNENNIGLRQR